MDRLMQEIGEQPEVLERLIDHEKDRVVSVCRKIAKKNIRFVLIAARGSSDNAGIYAKYLLGIRNSLPVALAAPSIFTLYKGRLELSDALVIGISQSGQSPDVVSVVESMKKPSNITLAITNDTESPLARVADEVLYCNAGEEKSIAATKTYTAQLFLVAMLSAQLAKDKNMLEVLKRIPVFCAAVLERADEVKELAERLQEMDRCVVIGRGYNYCTAFEYALKIKELAYVVALPYSSSDFLHGPIAILRGKFPCLMIGKSGEAMQSIIDFMENLRSRNSVITLFTDDAMAASLADYVFNMPVGIQEWASPIVYAIAGQLFAYFLAKSKGLDPERPAGLTKITKTI